MLQTKKHTTMGALRTVVLLFLSATLLFLSACTPQGSPQTSDDTSSGSDRTDVSATTDSSETTNTFDPSGGVTLDMDLFDYNAWFLNFMENRGDAEWYLPATPSSADKSSADMTMTIAEIQRILRKEQPLTAEQQAYLNRHSSDDRGVRAIHPDHLRVPVFAGVSISPKEPTRDGWFNNNYTFRGESYSEGSSFSGLDFQVLLNDLSDYAKIPTVSSVMTFYQSIKEECKTLNDLGILKSEVLFLDLSKMHLSFSGYSATEFEKALHSRWFRNTYGTNSILISAPGGEVPGVYTYIDDANRSITVKGDSNVGQRPSHIGPHHVIKSLKIVEEEHRKVYIVRRSEYHLEGHLYAECLEFSVNVLIEYDDGSHVGFDLSGSRDQSEDAIPLEYLRLIHERWLPDEILLHFDSIPLSAQNADSATE
ncbi:MAG: hypothetical protein IIW31_05635 [Clostridia bacterium]|nr:hypothetical protein [Clostridia bacterium]